MNRFEKTVCTLLAFSSLTLAGCARKTESSVSSFESPVSSTLSSSSSEVSSTHSETPSLPEAIAQIGSLDQAPIAAFDSGWIAVENGKAGLIAPDGTWAIDPKYDHVLLAPGFASQPQTNPIANPIFFYSIDGSLPSMEVSADGVQEKQYGGVGGVNPNYYALDENSHVVFYMAGQGPYDSSSAEFEQNLPAQPVSIYAQSDLADTQNINDLSCWIWNPANGKITGPYQTGVQPAFGIHSPASPVSVYNTLNSNAPVNGPYFAQESDGSYTIYSANGQQTRAGFESAACCGIDGIAASLDGTLFVLDGNLSELWSGPAQMASMPVGSTIALQQDGASTWALYPIIGN